MKKITVWAALLLCVLILLSACTKPVSTQSPQPSQEISPSETVLESAAVELPIDAKLEAMLPVLDSIIRASNEGGGAYAPKDAPYFWSVLYLVAANYGQQLGITESTDDGRIAVRRQAVQEIATACFKDYSDLLELPENVSVEYDESLDSYVFALSDMSEEFSTIVSAENAGDAVKVTVSFGTEAESESWVFEIVDNSYTEGISQPVYYYSVRSVERLS